MELQVPTPTGTLAGNTLCVIIQSGAAGLGSGSFVVTDDKANVWTTGAAGGSDSGDAQSCVIFTASNVAAGTVKVHIKNNTGSALCCSQPLMFECNDCASVDVISANNGTGTAAAGGSLAVTQTGDFVVHCAITSGTPGANASYTPTAHANITWQKVLANLQEGYYLGCGVYNSVSAFSPQVDLGTSVSHWITVSIAFKAATQGSPRPAGAYICGVHHYNLHSTGLTTFKMDVPAVGNLLGMLIEAGAGDIHITSLVDAHGDAWQQRGGNITNDGTASIWDAVNVTPGTDHVLTVTLNATFTGGTFIVIDVAGMAASPFDSVQTATGTQSVAGNLATASITPTTSNGLILCVAGQSFGTMNGLTDAAKRLLSMFYDGQSVSGPSNFDENNGWAAYFNPDLTAQTFTYTETAASPAAGAWESIAVAYKAATAGGGGLMTMGVG